ncbi:hypothetical protein IWX90DRAFT_249159 [Phyllosticta citrichinensis]|uniref:Secreted protein n=1 Tax=Phyllosticta citrichinensis TaxID=1130410 RepID=A0ABR1XR00_9PEZI
MRCPLFFGTKTLILLLLLSQARVWLKPRAEQCRGPTICSQTRLSTSLLARGIFASSTLCSACCVAPRRAGSLDGQLLRGRSAKGDASEPSHPSRLLRRFDHLKILLWLVDRLAIGRGG